METGTATEQTVLHYETQCKLCLIAKTYQRYALKTTNQGVYHNKVWSCTESARLLQKPPGVLFAIKFQLFPRYSHKALTGGVSGARNRFENQPARKHGCHRASESFEQSMPQRMDWLCLETFDSFVSPLRTASDRPWLSCGARRTAPSLRFWSLSMRNLKGLARTQIPASKNDAVEFPTDRSLDMLKNCVKSYQIVS